MTRLASIPFADRTWPLPVIIVLAPPERYHRDRGRHKTVVDRARRMMGQLLRPLPNRPIAAVADGGHAVLDLYGLSRSMARTVTTVTRMRLDTSPCEPPPPRGPGQAGSPRTKGSRLPRPEDLTGHPASRRTGTEAS